MKTLMLTLALSTLVGGAGDWPAFKGSHASGVAEGPAPVTWNIETGENVAWKTPIPGIGLSSPIVVGDRVFLTTAVAEGGSEYVVGLSEDLRSAEESTTYAWKVLCLDRQSGEVLWEKTLHEGTPRTKRHLKNSYATSTPASNGEVVVVSFGSEGLYALDLDGELLWKQDLGALPIGFYIDPSYQWGYGSSPTIYGDTVIVQVDTDENGFLAAYRLSDGSQVWSTPRQDKQSWSTPTVYLGEPTDVVVVNAPTHNRGYDPKNGKELWHYRWDQQIVISTPTVANGLIYVSTGKGDTQPILAIRPGARGDITLDEETKSSDHILWSRRQGGPIVTSPLVDGEFLYAMVDIGVFRCFSSANGKLHYQQRMPSSYLASPIAADGKVYLTAEEGEIHVIKAGSEYVELAVNSMGEPCVATPAIAGGTLIVRGLKHLFGLRTGAALPKPAPAAEEEVADASR